MRARSETHTEGREGFKVTDSIGEGGFNGT